MYREVCLTRGALRAVVCGCLLTVGAASAREPARLQLPDEPLRYADETLPQHFKTLQVEAFDTTPTSNPTSDAGVLLGRVLFYDTRLSITNTVSCASCHRQEFAFSDPRKFSIGFAGGIGDRNAMSLVNLRFARTGAFWDERGGPLEQQVLMPIESPTEMGHSLPEVCKILAADPQTRELFRRAFGDEEVTSERLARALAQFIRSLLSYSAKYDRGLAQVEDMNQPFPSFTAAENQGKQLFVKNCQICHMVGRGRQGALFSMFRALNNGIDASTAVSDGGSGDVSFDPNESGLFKPSSLRNIEKTAPYMHDGRFATLEEVIEHYSSGVKRHPGVSSFAFRMQFSAAEKTALLDFLKTLTDEKFLADPRFADPWKRDGTATTAVATAETTLPSLEQAKPLNAAERAQRIEAGQGLTATEVVNWLGDLDRDGDKALSREEYRAVVEVMNATGYMPRDLVPEGSRRGGRQRGGEERGADEDVEKAPATIADFDGDGTVSEREQLQYDSVKRFFELRDGGRLETRLDGVMATLDPADAVWRSIRVRLRDAKEALHRQVQASDKKMIAELRRTITDQEQYAAFQRFVLRGQGLAAARPRTFQRTSEQIDELVSAHLDALDADGNGKLAREELTSLARHLNAAAGGFGQKRTEELDAGQYARRILQLDRDGNGVISLAELPDRMNSYVARGDRNGDGELDVAEVHELARDVGYVQLIENGIYIGGAFGDAVAPPCVDSFDCDASLRERLQAAIDRYASELQSLRNAALQAQWTHLQAALNATADAVSKRD